MIGAGRAAARRQPVDDLVGAERLVARQQHLQHLAADRRQPLRARGAERLGMRERVAGAALVVVIGRGEDRAARAIFLAKERSAFMAQV